MILQGKNGVGSTGTIGVILYKEGPEGKGRPSDVMMRRVVASATGNPYAASNIVCAAPMTAPDGSTVCAKGAQNISSVTVTKTWYNPNQDEDAHGDGLKCTEWLQKPENLRDRAHDNPYDDARAHRGAMRGDQLVVGYTWTPNWAAHRNGNDKYDFYVRRSFDGGQTWTTDPAGAGVTHVDEFKIYTDGELDDEPTDSKRPRYTITTTVPAGAFEPAFNITKLRNNKESIIEPRIVAPPAGTVMGADGLLSTKPEDKFNGNLFYMAWGTSTNPGRDPVTHVSIPPEPLDLFYT